MHTGRWDSFPLAESSDDFRRRVGRGIEGIVAHHPEEARIYLRIAVSGALSDPATQAWLKEFHDTRTERLSKAVASSRPDLGPTEADAKAELLLAEAAHRAATSRAAGPYQP